MKFLKVKKLSFGRVFLVHISIALVILLLTGSVITGLYASYEKSVLKSQREKEINEFVSRLNKKTGEDSIYGQFLMIDLEVSKLGEEFYQDDVAIAMKNRSTGEVISSVPIVYCLSNDLRTWNEKVSGKDEIFTQEISSETYRTMREFLDNQSADSSNYLIADLFLVGEERCYLPSVYKATLGRYGGFVRIDEAISINILTEDSETDTYKVFSESPVSVAGSDTEAPAYKTVMKMISDDAWQEAIPNGYDYQIVEGVNSKGEFCDFYLVGKQRKWLGEYSRLFDYEVNNKTVIIAFWSVVVGLAFTISLLTAFVTMTREKAHQSMEQYQRDMTNGLAHDMKSPLMIISGYAENLKENVHTEKREHYADAILENVSYMNDIVADVMSLSKIEDGTYTLEKEELELMDLLVAAKERYAMTIEEKKLEVSVSGTCKVNGDRRLLKRAVENLVNNAVKYTPEEGKIAITADEAGISLTNDSQEKQKNGMGLSLVESICKLHGFVLTAKGDADTFTARIAVEKKK